MTDDLLKRVIKESEGEDLLSIQLLGQVKQLIVVFDKQYLEIKTRYDSLDSSKQEDHKA